MGLGVDVKPHAYDPVTTPELFDGVLPRRVIAFIIDLLIIAIPLVAAVMTATFPSSFPITVSHPNGTYATDVRRRR